MTPWSAAGAQPKTTQRQREIVQHDQDFLRLNFVKLRNCQNRIPAAIHEAQRFDQKDSSTSGQKCVLPRLRDRFFPSRSELGGQLVDDDKSDVVSRCGVLRAWISETGN
jgi:hypothetical protein